MIVATFIFNRVLTSDKISGAVAQLSDSVRPVYFGNAENKPPKTQLLSDRDSFQAFAQENRAGYFLFGHDTLMLNISFSEMKTRISFSGLDGVSAEVLDEIFSVLSALSPKFGFACLQEELNHRNRLIDNLDIGTIESWVGRDLNKYIPGVYWKTFFSERLLETHELNIDMLRFEELEVTLTKLGAGWLISYFENAEDWVGVSQTIDARCKSLDGLFSITNIRNESKKFSNYFEYDEYLSAWK